MENNLIFLLLNLTIPNVRMVIYDSKLIGTVNDTAATGGTETDQSLTGT